MLIGTLQKDWVFLIAPFGKIYLNILKMCILPILIAAISVSIGKLIKSEIDSHFMKNILMVLIGALIISSFIGTLGGLIGQPGADLDKKSLSVLGSIIREEGAPDLEMNLSKPQIYEEKESSLKIFLTSLFPSNIFAALSNGSNLQILVFSIMFGLAIGFIPEKPANHMVDTCDAIYKTFAKIVQWLMYLLPFGICGLIADQLSQMGFEIFFAMTKFVGIVISCFVILFILSNCVIWFKTRTSFSTVLSALKEPIVIALGTANSLASVPSALTAMHENLKFDKEDVDLLVPLCITLCRFGPVLYFAIASFFVAQLYEIPLGANEILLIFIGSILAGMATAGTSGITALPLMAIVLAPLELPLDAVLVLFIVVDPIISPFRVLAIVHTSCAAAATIIPYHRDPVTVLDSPAINPVSQNA